jgi:hypothetical protein
MRIFKMAVPGDGYEDVGPMSSRIVCMGSFHRKVGRISSHSSQGH